MSFNPFFNDNPTESDFLEIENWLEVEAKTSNQGFYSDIDTIRKAFKENLLVTLNINSKASGFICWNDGGIHVELNYMEVIPEYRQKGFGNYFYSEFAKYVLIKGFKAIKLSCSPTTSEFFWRKMGFTPLLLENYPHLTFYKFLITHSIPNSNVDPLNKLELWNCQENEIKNQKPKWTWNLDSISAKTPFLIYCDKDWHLRLTKKEIIIKECKVKYFDKEIRTYPFLLLEQIV